MAKWIVELEPGVYLADGEGDPPRTLEAASARVFGSHPRACTGIKTARNYRPFEHARVTLAPLSSDDSDPDDGVDFGLEQRYAGGW